LPQSRIAPPALRATNTLCEMLIERAGEADPAFELSELWLW